MSKVEDVSRKKIITIISALFPEAKIYLFGSRARGTARKWSDIDIALDTGSKISFVQIGEAKDVVSALNIPYKVDIADLNSMPKELRSLVLQEGILWKH